MAPEANAPDTAAPEEIAPAAIDPLESAPDAIDPEAAVIADCVANVPAFVTAIV
jgi:hypothetical protein